MYNPLPPWTSLSLVQQPLLEICDAIVLEMVLLALIGPGATLSSPKFFSVKILFARVFSETHSLCHLFFLVEKPFVYKYVVAMAVLIGPEVTLSNHRKSHPCHYLSQTPIMNVHLARFFLFCQHNIFLRNKAKVKKMRYAIRHIMPIVWEMLSCNSVFSQKLCHSFRFSVGRVFMLLVVTGLDLWLCNP